MRVLLLHSRYRSGSASGENRVVEDEVRLLREGGHEVDVLTPEPDAQSVLARGTLGASAVWSASAVRSVRDRIARSRPDVVHVHNVFPTLSPAVIRAAATEAPVVMTLHNYRLHCLPGTLFRDGRVCTDCVGRVPWRGVAHRCYRGSTGASAALATSLTVHRAIGTFDRVRLFLAVSEFVRERYLLAGIEPSRIRTLPNFSWPMPRREGPGSHFLFVGRLSIEKGFEHLLRTWRDVEAPLVVVGDGPSFEDGRRVPDGVSLVGRVAPPELASLIAKSRAAVVPSLWLEPGSRVVIEAAAAGVPSIASRTGGLAEMVRDGISGILVQPGDVRSLAEAATALLDDGTSARLGAGAEREWRERFTPERAFDGLVDAFREAS